jgi:hypothetical protein
MAKEDHAKKGLVNVKVGNHSTLKLDVPDVNLTGFDTVRSVVDNSHTAGAWNGRRVKGSDAAHELRLQLTCATQPQKERSKDSPDGGTLSITLANSDPTPATLTVIHDAVYTNDPPP